jgi:hypothetical protein
MVALPSRPQGGSSRLRTILALAVCGGLLAAVGIGVVSLTTPHAPSVVGPAAPLTAAMAGTTPSVHSHTWADNHGPTTTTPGVDIARGSTIFVFVGYVNSIDGGGGISSLSDSSGNGFTEVTTTGYAENHTETLWVALNASPARHDKVSVTFSGGDTTQGGSVAVVDVVNSGETSVDFETNQNSGYGSTAAVSYTASGSHELFLFGVSGDGRDAPLTAGVAHEKRLNTGSADAGPFQDGMGFGTFSLKPHPGVFSAVANLPSGQQGVWNAILVEIPPA